MSQTLTYVIGGDRRALVDNIQDFKVDFGDDNHNWVQARQFERGMRQVFVNIVNEDNTPFDLTGCNVWFEGLLPKAANGDFRVIDSDGYVPLDPSSGKFRFDMPGHAFTVAGSYRQAFFRIVKNGNSVTTLEFDLDVLADKVIDGLVPKDWIGPFETIADQLVDGLQKHTDAADKIISDFQQKVTDLVNQLNQQGSTTTSMLTEIQNRITALETKIKQDDLITQGKMDKTLGALSDFKMPGTTVADKINGEFEGRGVNVKWFGAVGDGTHDDTAAFQAAYLASKNIYIPAGTYYLTGFHVPADTKIIGDNAILELHCSTATNGNNVLAGAQGNSTICGLKIHSLEANLEWNRFDITSQKHITIRNCEFTGFRHISNAPNAWGIYLDHSSNIKIKNCKFDNNSQSDIAIVEGCSDILIDNCSGLNDTFYIDVEPNNADDDVANIVINQCELSKLSLLNPSIIKPMGTQISVNNSHVKLLNYCGFDVSFNDSKIDAVNPYFLPNSNNVSGGTIKLNGALGLSANLITDPHMQSYASVPGATAKWIDIQGTMTTSEGTTRFADENGSLTMIGTRSSTPGQIIFNPEMRYKDQSYLNKEYPVVEGDMFMITLVGKADYPTGTVWPSMNALFKFYDVTDKLIINIAVSLLKAAGGEDADYGSRSAFVKVPTGAVKMTWGIGNCAVAQSTALVYIGTVALQRLTNAMNSVQLEALPVGSNHVIYSTAVPSSAYGWGHYQPGDICYNSSPAKGQPYGWICINEGYPGDWSPLGNI